MQKREDEKSILAIIFIALGLILISKQINNFILWPDLMNHSIFYFPFPLINKLTNILLTWPTVLIFTGLLLIAGRRKVGYILIITGVFFLFLKIVQLSFISFPFFIPLLLIIFGLILILKATISFKY